MRALALMTLGLLAVVAQGAVAAIVQPPWCPDFALDTPLSARLSVTTHDCARSRSMAPPPPIWLSSESS